jgi:hypothetical protein
VENAVKKSVSYLMIKEVILHQGSSLSICLQALHGGLAVSPSPHPSPENSPAEKEMFLPFGR